MIASNSRLFIVCSLLLLLAAALEGHAQETPAEETGSRAERTHAFADEEAAKYEIVLAESEAKLDRVPQSILRWSNLTRKSSYGDTYLWTHEGCAKAILSVYTLGGADRMTSLEFQSLSLEPLEARRDGKVVWSPQEAGLSFEELTDVGEPGKSRAVRTTQMNAIARSFRGQFASHEQLDEFNELRLLNKPLYRYKSRDPKVIDGAIYAFVEATDPELLLVIEAHKKGDTTEWVYSGARSRHDHLRLYRDGRLVWDREPLAPPWENMRQPDGTYYNQRWEVLADPEELSKAAELFENEP